MSYLDRTANPRQRSTAIAAVIAIHALLGYILLTGLIQQMGPRHRDIFSGYFHPDPPPPPPQPPEDQEKPKHVDEKVNVPRTDTDLTKDDSQFDVTHDEHTVTDATSTPKTPDPPPPPPAPRFSPTGPSPINSPGSWAVTDDYPARDLRDGNEGMTVFRATIGVSGRVTGCEIVRSSGHPGLDAATCKAVKARARFSPATDENGDAVTGAYSSSVHWQIPR